MTTFFAIMFGIGVAMTLLALMMRVLNPPPVLEIGERGILDRRLGCGWIPWEEIEGAYPPGPNEVETVRLRVRITDRLGVVMQRKSGTERTTGDSLEILLDLSGTELGAVEFLQRVQGRGRSVEAAAQRPS